MNDLHHTSDLRLREPRFQEEEAHLRCWGRRPRRPAGRESAGVCPDGRAEPALPLECTASAAGTGAGGCPPGQLGQGQVWFSPVDYARVTDAGQSHLLSSSVPVNPRLADFFMRCFSSLLPARLTSWAQTPSMGSVKGRFWTLKFTAGS